MAAVHARLVGFVGACFVCATVSTQSPLMCRPAGRLSALPGLGEASGVTVSRHHQGILWSHNDSGSTLFALSFDGSIKGRVRLRVERLDDWEDLAVGPCPAGSCVYAADIGDNNRSRQRITIYRVPEPGVGDGTTAAAEAFHATYPDGPRDAEGFFMTSANDWFVVTKDVPVTLYRFPNPPKAGASVQLQRVAVLDGVLGKEKVTGASASPDGDWVVLRTGRSLLLYRASQLQSGNPGDALRFDLSALGEPQGEGVALGADGTVYLAGEAGGLNGTFARLVCSLPR